MGPAGNAFYTPPSPLAEGAPGDVIWYRRAEPTSVLGTIGLIGANAWQILYHSTDALGRAQATRRRAVHRVPGRDLRLLAPELPLRGVVTGGTPADLAVVAEGLDGGLGFPFLAMAAIGLDAAYPDLDLDSYLNEAGRTDLRNSQTQCVGELLFSYTGKHISDYTTVNPLTAEAWQARLAEQKLGGTAPGVPVFLGHGVQDELIPYNQVVQLRQDWCVAGATVTWSEYVGEHLITLVAMQNDGFSFLADRFAGRTVVSSC